MHGGAESLLLSSAGMAGVSEHLQSVSEFIQVWSASSSTPATVTVSLHTRARIQSAILERNSEPHRTWTLSLSDFSPLWMFLF